LSQAGIHGGYDSQRGSFGFEGAGSFVHSSPALPHEVACEDKWPGACEEPPLTELIGGGV
jgi:hypothetical protein